MGFADSIRAFETKALGDANHKVTKAITELFTEVIQKTPNPTMQPRDAIYSQGVLSNQWYVNVGKTFSSELNSTSSPTGADSLSRLSLLWVTPLFWGKDNTITFTNNSPYAYRAENLGWPKGEGTNDWIWSGRVGAYKMVSTSINNFKGAYS